jgi:hypothetical protein
MKEVIASNKQMDMFKELVGDESALSNLLNLWDLVPKYSVSRQMQASLRNESGQLPVLKKEILLPNGDSCELSIKPASIEENDGNRKDYYPAESEELIEDVLRKIFLNENMGSHETGDKSKSWVRFTKRLIFDELKRHKKGRSIDDITQSLIIMSEARIQITIGGKQAYSGSILPEQLLKNREEYRSDPNSLSAVRFSSMVSESIDNLDFRQYNYDAVMMHSSQLARWIHKRLSREFTNANKEPQNHFKLMYSEIEASSGLLNHSRKTRRIDCVRKAIEELVNNKALTHFDEHLKIAQGSKRVEDAEFKLYPSDRFVKDTIEANVRHKSINAEKKRGEARRLISRGSRRGST